MRELPLDSLPSVSSEGWGKEEEKASCGFREKGSVRELSWDGKASWLEKNSRITEDMESPPEFEGLACPGV